MALSRAHTSARAADPAHIVSVIQTPAEAYPVIRDSRAPANPMSKTIVRPAPKRNHNPHLTITHET